MNVELLLMIAPSPNPMGRSPRDEVARDHGSVAYRFEYAIFVIRAGSNPWVCKPMRRGTCKEQ